MRVRSVLAVAAVLAATLSIGGARADAPIAMCNVPIPVSDGVVLRATITRPDSEVHPTILSVTGYSKGASQNCSPSSSALVKAGYNVMTLDDRGTGSSGGRWDIWSARTQQDYPEVLQWLESQPWQNGVIGTSGTSYVAITSLLVAETGDPHIKAVWADYPMSDAYRDVTFFGGNLDTTFMPFWFGFTQGTTSQGDPDVLTQDSPTGPQWLQNVYDHGTAAPAVFGANLISASLLGDKTSPERAYDYPEGYGQRSPITKINNIRAAVWMNGGWFDIFQRGEPILFNALSHDPHIPDNGVKWVQGPDYHAAADAHWADMGIGTESQTQVAWFDHWLKGVDNGIQNVAPAHLWDVNQNRWETAQNWPIAGTQWTSLYLSAATSGTAHSLNDGSLVDSSPAVARELLPYQPTGGICNRGVAQWSATGAGAQCASDERAGEANTFTYTTPALTSPLHIAGPVTLNLQAELDRQDASFYAALTDVAPDGSSTQITAGALDASFEDLDWRRTWRNEDGDVILPFHPFTVESQHDILDYNPHDYLIEIYPTDWTLLPGHSLRLVVGTADTPHYQVAQDRLQKMIGGTIRVLDGGSTPSRLLLPVIPEE